MTCSSFGLSRYCVRTRSMRGSTSSALSGQMSMSDSRDGHIVRRDARDLDEGDLDWLIHWLDNPIARPSEGDDFHIRPPAFYCGADAKECDIIAVAQETVTKEVSHQSIPH